jgi:hypothetical protein
VTLYRDNTCILPVEIYEFFTNRKDKLEIRKRFPLEGRFEEMFGPGRLPEALKKRIEYIGFKRELHFYTSARNDGLVKREEIIQKRINEFYEARDDFLIYRSVSIAGDKDEIDSRIPYVLPGGPTGELAIRKMVEKFSHNPFVIADEVRFYYILCEIYIYRLHNKKINHRTQEKKHITFKKETFV